MLLPWDLHWFWLLPLGTLALGLLVGIIAALEWCWPRWPARAWAWLLPLGLFLYAWYLTH